MAWGKHLGVGWEAERPARLSFRFCSTSPLGTWPAGAFAMAACYRTGNLPERYCRRRGEKGGRHVVRVPVHALPVEPASTAAAPAGARALVPGRGVAAVIARRESPNPLAVSARGFLLWTESTTTERQDRLPLLAPRLAGAILERLQDATAAQEDAPRG